MSARFGRERVRRGIEHFLAGKLLSAVAGLGAVILVVRGLSVSDFASYSVLVALVEVFTAISGLGLAHVVLRFVPELYATHRAKSLRTVVFTTIGIRTLVLLAALLAAYALSATLAHWLNLGMVEHAFELFLLVVALRSSAHFLSQILESALHQGFAQMAFLTAAVGRFLGMVWLLQGGHISLIEVVALEALCDAASCAILIVGLATVLARDKAERNPSEDDKEWWSLHRSDVTKFAVSAYLQHLATLPFGGNTNRLVGGVMFGNKLMASFGFALSLYEYIKRYLPTQLLIGLIRPVVVARFAVNRSFEAAGQLCDRALHINLIVIFGVMSLLLVAGRETMLLISAQKYGAESVWLLVALLILLALETQRVILELLTQTVEQYRLMIPSNLFLSASVLLGIGAFPFLGALAFPLANALALAVANIWLARRLSGIGHRYARQWRGPAITAGILVVASLTGLLVKWAGAHWLISAAITGGVYAAFTYYLQRTDVVLFIRELVGSKA